MVMGILNVTPDSFSDGGRYLSAAAAVARGRQMAAEGADVVDVGGESSRPGAAPVGEKEELRRVVPVVEALAGEVRVSVDTTKPAVARAAVAAGASLINDISASLWPVAAELSVGWVAMHMRGTPRTMDGLTHYDDVAAEVRDYLVGRAQTAAAGGVGEIWVDPGVGFAKTAAQNLRLLATLPELAAAAAGTGSRVLVGTSRKRFLGQFGAGHGQRAPAEDRPAEDRPAEDRPAEDRMEASLATAVWCMAAGAGMVRVHDVSATVDAAVLVGPSPAGAAGDGERNVGA
jgi:dihydropteroate synthase